MRGARGARVTWTSAERLSSPWPPCSASRWVRNVKFELDKTRTLSTDAYFQLRSSSSSPAAFGDDLRAPFERELVQNRWRFEVQAAPFGKKAPEGQVAVRK